METKDPNPKDAAAETKIPLHIFPPTAIFGGSVALFDGLLKYGRANYRATDVLSSVYQGAVLRHMMKWFSGEDLDVDMQMVDGALVDVGSGLPNLWHALAGIAILIDADAAGSLIDDRDFPGGFLGMFRENSGEIARLRLRHAERRPRHYDIRDARKETIPVTVAPETREIARKFIISEGAVYYRSVLESAGVESFEDLPDTVLSEIAAFALADGAGPPDPAWDEFVAKR